jgi:hypothetical protein
MGEKWVVLRDSTICGREKNLSSVLKFPRQCPLVLPVGVKHLSGMIIVKFYGAGGGLRLS